MPKIVKGICENRKACVGNCQLTYVPGPPHSERDGWVGASEETKESHPPYAVTSSGVL